MDFPEDIQKEAADIQRQFVDHGATLVDPELIHITIKFIGDVDDKQVDAIKNALQNVHHPPFDAEINGIGVFPDVNHINVIWTGVNPSISQHFEKLHSAVEGALMPLKIRADKRKFTAHATLARVKRLSPVLKSLRDYNSGRCSICHMQKRSLINTIREFSDISLGKMRVDHIKLKKSTLTSDGPIYKTLLEVGL